ncbi:MAG TPA: ATP-binding protein, partial [Dissulfurispiraceae bacterium]|nr:ATP-binding protein [Dissulfurispiraceae bacterium]
QVIMNLATNARDAMPEGGGLRITTCRLEMPRPEGGSQSPLRYAELSVSDTGAGIPEEHIEHIFEPFYTTKEVGKGTGLGLAVAYGIISQHGGSIEAISMNGSGTTMRVLLPLSDDTPLERHDIAPDSVHDEGGTILLVEDDDTVRLAIQRLLEHSGYTVLVARDGIEGTDIFRHHASAVDVALLDVVMPRMSGKQLCDQLKALKPELKVIFMSGYPDDRLGGILCDGVSYMSKPVMPDKLLAGIRSVLGS